MSFQRKTKVTLQAIFILAVALCLSACNSTSETPKELTNTAVYEDFTLTLNNSITENAENGAQVLRVNATYTNNSQDPCYAASCFTVRAFQHNIEIADISNINENEAALIQEIQNGQTLNVSYVFELSDMSEVEILIGEPTANQTTIGKAIYTLE